MLRLLATGLATAAVALASIRHLYVIGVLCKTATEPALRGGVFYTVAGICALGPGLFLLSRTKLRSATLFDAPLFGLASGFGSTILVLWLLFLPGLYTKAALGAVLTGFAAAGASGLLAIVRAVRRTGIRPLFAKCSGIPLSDWVFLAFAAWLSEGVFETRSGLPFMGMDAILSWDRWALNIAERTGLGTHVMGSYPPGLPLFRSVAYKLDLGSDVFLPLSLEHLLAGGWELGFALILVLLSIGAICRRRGASAFPAVALLFATKVVRECIDPPHVGDADVVFLGLFLAAFAAAEAFGPQLASGPRWRSFALLPAMFASVFIKGSGCLLVPLALASAALCNPDTRSRAVLRSGVAAVLLAAPFYAHQWVVGRWLRCADPDPFFRSHSLRVAWTSLFKPDWPHFAKCSEVFFGTLPGAADSSHVAMPATRLFGPETAAVLGILALLSLLLVPKRTRFAALTALVWLPVWFLTTSYDWRNALGAVAFAAIAIGIAATDAARRIRLGPIPAFAGAILLAWMTGRDASFPFRETPYRPHRELARTLDNRMARASLAGLDWDFANSSPWGRRAPCILSDGPDAYLYSGKGVRRTSGPGIPPEFLPGCLAFRNPNRPLRSDTGFLPVGLLGPKGKKTVFLHPSARTEVPFRETTDPSDPGAVFVSVETDWKDGFASVSLADPEADATIELAPELRSSARMPDLFRPISLPGCARMAFWIDGTTNGLRFVVRARSGECRPVSVEILR